MSYNAENQLIDVTGASMTASFVGVYPERSRRDGDGARVKSTINGVTTYFIGAHYEVTGSQITKYYFAGASRIAMRTYTVPQNSTLNYVLTDHFGSTSIVTNASGGVVSQTFYKAWGETRYTSGAVPTKYTYTGQYSYTSDFGLMFYNARWYDSLTGRFAQADTIVPAGVQGLDRYAYVNNSPLISTDPSGHLTDKQIEKWTGLKIEDLNGELLKMLRAARFGDALYGYDRDGNLVSYGILQLDDTGHLAFGSTSTFNLLNSGMAGWMLTRNIGGTSYVAYATGGYEFPSDVGEEGLYPLGEGQEEVVSVLGKLVETTLGGVAVGLGVEVACKGCSKGVIIVLTTAMGFLYGVGDLIFGSHPGDQILTYYYEDSSGQVWEQVVILRDGQIISYEVTPYTRPWYWQIYK